MKEYDSPGIPNETLVKIEDKVIDIDNYRSFVGKIMFVATKMCPKIGSAVRALSLHMGNPGAINWNTMNRLIGFMKKIKLKGNANRRRL